MSVQEVAAAVRSGVRVEREIPTRLLISFITGPLGIVFGLMSLMVRLADRGALVGFGLVYSLMFLIGVSLGAVALACALSFRRDAWSYIGRGRVAGSIVTSVAALIVSAMGGAFVIAALFN